MKMKVFDRLVMRFFGILAIITGAMLFLVPVGVFGKMEFRYPWIKWAFFGGGALTALIGLYDLFIPRRYRYNRKDFIIRHTENGDMQISIKAMEGLVEKCVNLHDEIKMTGMRVNNRREGVSVDMRVSLASNISIPLAVESLQKQVKQYLLASTGVEIRQVRVVVSNTQGEVQETPYQVDSRTEEPEEAEQTAEEKKPLHRRIFEQAEQAKETVTDTAPAEGDNAQDIAAQTEAAADDNAGMNAEANDDSVKTAEETAEDTAENV